MEELAVLDVPMKLKPASQVNNVFSHVTQDTLSQGQQVFFVMARKKVQPDTTHQSHLLAFQYFVLLLIVRSRKDQFSSASVIPSTQNVP
jgi:hypothetical protein